jgi:putative hydrolase of the HAD superfamily
MTGIRHIFFDLDHTLWDFEQNSRETLEELFTEYRRHIAEETSFDDFFRHYSVVNQNLWRLYRENRINSAHLREVRFRDTFSQLGIPQGEWVADFGKKYMDVCPTKTTLMPGAYETLEYLFPRYGLHLVTNGFTQTQSVKLKSAGLEKFFRHVITSENAGAKKPDAVIFQFALELAQADVTQSLFVGDDYEADVLGALSMGFKVVFYNPERQPNPLRVPEIRHLAQLKSQL